MNDYELLYAIGGIDVKYVKSADRPTVPRKGRRILWGAVAACVLIAIGAMSPSIIGHFRTGHEEIKPADGGKWEPPATEDDGATAVMPPEEAKKPGADEYLEENPFYGGSGPSLREEAYMTYTLKDPVKEILLPEFSEEQLPEELPVYSSRSEASDDVLKENYDKFTEIIENIRQNEDDSVPADAGQISIRSMPHAITVLYSLKGCSDHVTDHSYIWQLIETDPVVKAACTYAGISDPVVSFTNDHTINEDYPQNGEYSVTDATDKGNNTIRKVFLYIDDRDDISIIIYKPENFVEEGVYPVRDYKEAVQEFCEKYDLTEEDVVMSGLTYIDAEQPGLFVPYYELLVPNPGVPMSDWFDPEEYANYDLILLPAVMR